MKRSPLRRGRPLRRLTPLRSRSTKRRIEERERVDVRARVLARDRGCILGHLRPCSGPLDVDEIVPRGRGGSWLDDANCQTLCRRHHEMKHARPHLASILGLYGDEMQAKHAALVGVDVADHAALARLIDVAEQTFNRSEST